MIKCIHQARAAHGCILQSFDPQGIEKVRKLGPTIELHCLVADNLPVVSQRLSKGFQRGSCTCTHGVGAMNPNHKFASRAKIKRLQRHGKKVFVWTENDADPIHRMIRRGTDGIITKLSGQLIAMLRAQGPSAGGRKGKAEIVCL